MEISKEQKLKFKNILVNHDIDAFRFAMKRVGAGDYYNESDEVVSKHMHILKSQMFYLGEEFIKSRRILRIEKFGYNEKLPVFANADGSIPTCFQCKRFMEAPDEETPPCSSRGAMPEDIACPGYITSEQ